MRERWVWVVCLVCGWWVQVASAQGYVTCESRDGGYRECYSGFQFPPVLVRQLSSAACVEGRTWGHRPGLIWVSRGCRATFEESSGYWQAGGGESLVCESWDGRYHECRTGIRGPVQIVEQYSRAACIEGRSWGRLRDGVWVDRGCRARFASYYGGNWRGGSYWGNESDYLVECESKEGRYRSCPWGHPGRPFVLEQLSIAPCVRGRSWGYDRQRDAIWVDQGCRAVFGAR
jgi:hypothetical protein